MLTLDAVSKIYGAGRDGHHALDAITLSIDRGQFWCVLGPSGCGKSTFLNIVAGFEPATGGRALLDGRPIGRAGPDRAVVFQDSNASLFPWLTAYENVAFGLRRKGLSGTETERIASHYLGLVGLAEDRHKLPAQLSGGMRQRIQIARALAIEPDILLMDEPFASLDAQTRRRMHHELLAIWQATGTTIVFVTHDVAEALTLADRIAILSRGPGSRVKEVLAAGLPRPRDPATPEFNLAFERVESLIDRARD